MTTEKICFRYDGSEEAKKCIEWINKGKPRYQRWSGVNNALYAPDGFNSVTTEDVTTTHRLVTPAEFLRIVKGESESKWKVGDECMVDDCKITYQILSIINGYAWLYSDEGHITANISALRPVRKSLREEMIEWAKKHESVLEAMPELLSIIDRHEKERGVEG